ncbi:MAG: Na(+)/H(+) antiporter subunit F [Candidatus Scalindua rubra]|uniref:Na(+)/H(+) antiporter subunit F n=1 Tax=Candidatus Scalindua rubra TaxID=1872076 RepID=A0A1E3XAR0_9BACT|nr:MAG: Na(+)/H(+) antiporter subunit F [Candidatus Scalindua rubra]
MFDIATVAVILAIMLTLYRAIKGPTIYDRVLAGNAIGTKAVVILVLIGFVYGRPHFLDLALVYTLINFIATIAFLKYREMGRLD